MEDAEELCEGTSEQAGDNFVEDADELPENISEQAGGYFVEDAEELNLVEDDEELSEDTSDRLRITLWRMLRNSLRTLLSRLRITL